MKKVSVALLGLGTVGGGTYRIIKSQHDQIAKKYGVDLAVGHVLERNMERVAQLGVDPAIVSTDIENVIKNPDIKIVAEFFGGIEPARTFLLKCLEAGKSIVTANKELFSKYWQEFEAAASKTGAGLYFEASCAGGVPIIRALTESIQGNDILEIKGIINGTTNYILTKMSENGQSYADALSEAQKLGYAEFNPTADVDGYDASYKLSILSTLAYGKRVPIDRIYREGIREIKSEDIASGKEFGLTLKLLAISKMTNGRVEARVHPVFISDKHPLANVRNSFNAVFVKGNNVGDLMFYGRGAGDLPTGSAIVSDIVYCACKSGHRRFPFMSEAVTDADFMSDFESSYFIRMTVRDEAGVLASIAGEFGRQGISITSMVQREGSDNVPIIFITHKTKESSVNNAAAALLKNKAVKSIDSIIRVEE